MSARRQLRRRQLYVWLIATALVTMCAVVYAAHARHGPLALIAVAMFCVAAVIVAVAVNQLIETAANGGTANTAASAAGHNAALMTVVFGWGGATILSAYYLTDLFWHHAWQYGGAMIIAAVLIDTYRRVLVTNGSRLATPLWLARSGWLALVQATAAAGGLAFLALSGKLSRHNSDWIANHVFVAGGVALTVVSLLAFLAQRSTSHRN